MDYRGKLLSDTLKTPICHHFRVVSGYLLVLSTLSHLLQAVSALFKTKTAPIFINYFLHHVHI